MSDSKTNAAIIACATLKPELNRVMAEKNTDLPVFYADSGLHVEPDKLRAKIQELIDGLPDEIATVLLLFGFCGNSLVGIKAGERTLVLPMVADCIPIFLGSQQRRDEIGSRTYFFTEGYLHFEHTFITEHSRYLERYGEKRANSIMKKMMAHYTQLAVIDTGVSDADSVADEVSGFAGNLEIPVTIVPGDLRLIHGLLEAAYGMAGGEFLVVRPNGGITFEDSLKVGKGQF